MRFSILFIFVLVTLDITILLNVLILFQETSKIIVGSTSIIDEVITLAYDFMSITFFHCIHHFRIFIP
jgi:hypothetical protein